jgi:3'(2'), 5'-bisphosphate nucleotidase
MFYQEKLFLDNFIKLIKECNEIILNIYKTDFEVYNKDDESPLTMADKMCNDHICKYLNSLNIKNSKIISEENKNDEYINRKDIEWIWLVDPVDGTKEFVKKNGQFTVNIGLCQNGIPVFGIVSIPVTGEIYYGIKGLGSFKLYNNNLKKLEILDKKLSKKGVRVVASSSHMNDKTREFIEKYNEPIIISTGSSIKLLWIAENKADIYPRIAPTSEWDTCAAHAVVKYAGGNVINYDTEIELVYNKENLLNPFFICI